jgi:hypothetical protein
MIATALLLLFYVRRRAKDFDTRKYKKVARVRTIGIYEQEIRRIPSSHSSRSAIRDPAAAAETFSRGLRTHLWSPSSIPFSWLCTLLCVLCKADETLGFCQLQVGSIPREWKQMPYTVNASVSCPLYSLAPARGARRHRFSVNGRRTTLAQVFSQRRRPCSIWTWQGETSLSPGPYHQQRHCSTRSRLRSISGLGWLFFLRLAMSMPSMLRFGLRPARFGSI